MKKYSVLFSLIFFVLLLFIFMNGKTNPSVLIPINSDNIAVEDCNAVTADVRSIILENHNQIDPYRRYYSVGTCYSLTGRQTVVLFFMDDDQSAWSAEDVTTFTDDRILPALDFLQKQAKRWNVELSFEVKRFSTAFSPGLQMVYKGSVNPDLSIGGSTKDLMEQAGNILGYDTEISLLKALKVEYQTDAIIPVMVVNKSGTSYARQQLTGTIGNVAEHAVIFADRLDWTAGNWKYSDRVCITIAHEILHLFGAEDYYLDETRRKLAEKYCIDDIMLVNWDFLAQTKVEHVTAYYIGWSDKIPVVCQKEGWVPK